MNRKQRRLALFALPVATLTAIVAACSFPDPTFGPTSGGSEGGVDGGGDGAVDDGAFDGAILFDGETPDAVITQDAGSKIDAAGCLATDCDCDGDDASDRNKAICVDAGKALDCDDLDTRYRPDQDFVDKVPDQPPAGVTLGDWNCSGQVEKLYPPNTVCAGAGGASCDGKFGFVGDPPCGMTGAFVRCKSGGLLGSSCVEADKFISTFPQACK